MLPEPHFISLPAPHDCVPSPTLTDIYAGLSCQLAAIAAHYFSNIQTWVWELPQDSVRRQSRSLEPKRNASLSYFQIPFENAIPLLPLFSDPMIEGTVSLDISSIRQVPFPFPYSQMVILMLTVYTLVTPVPLDCIYICHSRQRHRLMFSPQGLLWWGHVETPSTVPKHIPYMCVCTF